MSTQANSNSVIKESKRQPIVVSRIFVSDFQKEGTLTAELKQTVITTSKYPGKSVANDLQDNLFGVQDFNFETKDFEQSRVDVAWIDVPLGTTIQDVEAKLAQNPEACIYRIISNKPILHSGQQARLESISTIDEANELFYQIANRQVLRFSNNDETRAGQLILDNLGRPQYKATFFSTKNIADDDRRTNEPSDFIASPEIIAELSKSVQNVQGQTV